MCTCRHGSDRHYVDYAYGHGMWLGKCLEQDCPCKLFENGGSTAVHHAGIVVHPVSNQGPPSSNVGISSRVYST